MVEVTEKTRADTMAIAEELQFVVGALVRQMRAVSPASEVTLSQISILKRLERDGPHTAADLARLDKITHQSVAVTVAALVDLGLLHRIPDEHDLRRKLLVITDSGKHLLTERREAGYNQLASTISTRLNGPEQDRLAEALGLLGRLIE